MIGVHIDRRQHTQSGQRDDGPRATGVALVRLVRVVVPWRLVLLLGGRLPPRRVRRDLPPLLGAAPMKGGGPRREGGRQELSHGTAGSAPALRAWRAARAALV